MAVYRVKRTKEEAIVTDERGSEVYKGNLEGFVIYKLREQVLVAQVKEMSDKDLLSALATAIRLPTDATEIAGA